jgi:hypothetical protein
MSFVLPGEPIGEIIQFGGVDARRMLTKVIKGRRGYAVARQECRTTHRTRAKQTEYATSLSMVSSTASEQRSTTNEVEDRRGEPSSERQANRHRSALLRVRILFIDGLRRTVTTHLDRVYLQNTEERQTTNAARSPRLSLSLSASVRRDGSLVVVAVVFVEFRRCRHHFGQRCLGCLLFF